AQRSGGGLLLVPGLLGTQRLRRGAREPGKGHGPVGGGGGGGRGGGGGGEAVERPGAVRHPKRHAGVRVAERQTHVAIDRGGEGRGEGGGGGGGEGGGVGVVGGSDPGSQRR